MNRAYSFQNSWRTSLIDLLVPSQRIYIVSNLLSFFQAHFIIN